MPRIRRGSTRSDGHGAEDDLQEALVVSEFLAKSSKERTKTYKDERKAKDEGQRAHEGSPPT